MNKIQMTTPLVDAREEIREQQFRTETYHAA